LAGWCVRRDRGARVAARHALARGRDGGREVMSHELNMTRLLSERPRRAVLECGSDELIESVARCSKPDSVWRSSVRATTKQ